MKAENLKNTIVLAAALSHSVALAAVPAPWTPVEARDGVVSVWGREYAFASNALPVSVKAIGSELLSGPMRLVCADANGHEIVWKKGGSWIQERDEDSATVCAWQEADAMAADATARIEFDGTAKITLALMPGPQSRMGMVSKAWLEIPLASSAAKLFAFFPAQWDEFGNVGEVRKLMNPELY